MRARVLQRLRIVLAFLAMAGTPLLADSGRPAPTVASEHQIKAVFLFNFAQFVQWPEGALGMENDPFLICILGTDPFGPDLDEVVAGEAVQGRPMQIRRLDSAEGARDCHIAYVDAADAATLGEVLSVVRNHPTLLVSDVDRAAEQGAIIQFHQDQNRVRLRINLGAARSAGLVISSKLLRPATVIGGGKG